MAIPTDVIDKIITNANIVDVIGEYIKLKRSGVNHKAVCPFHGDKDASLVVSSAKNMWKCFGCGEGGNVLSFVMKHESISFYEAAKIIASKYGIAIPERELTDEEKESYKHKESLQICLSFAQEAFLQKRKLPEAETYLTTRKVNLDILERYGVGFSPRSFAWLYEQSQTKGYDKVLMQQAGLINIKDDGKIYDRFINRITFPFYSISGQIIGYTGRSLDKESDCKYLNSPETLLFEKSKVLYGIFQAKQSIAKADKCYLVEGQFDVLSFSQYGFSNTVCGSGTAFTKEQARLLKKFTKNITLVYDGDAAGVKASIRNIDILLAEGLNVRAVLLPKGEDPDSFANKMGPEKLAKYLSRNEKDFISFIYHAHKAELEDPIKKIDVLKSIAQSIAIIPDKLQQKEYIATLAKKFNADGELISKSVKESSLPIQPEITENKEPGFTGLEDASNLLNDKKKELTLTWSVNRFTDDWGEIPTVLVTDAPGLTDIQELRRVSPVIRCRDRFEINPESIKEPTAITFLVSLSRSGFSITMSRYNTESETYTEEGEEKTRKIQREVPVSFNEYYIELYSSFSSSTERNKKIAIERCAEMMSYMDATTRAIQITNYARALGVAKTALEKILKPFIDARKSETRYYNDSYQQEGTVINYDPTKTPDYVENDAQLKRLLESHHYYPLLDNQARKIAYMFKMGNSNSFMRVGNFFLEPLLHVYDKDSNLNKRIVQLTQSIVPYPIYMEWISKEMISLQSFRQRLWEQGDINFSNGTQSYLDQIIDSWAGKFKKCYELRNFGWYDEGFYAFSNAIVHDIEGVQRVDYVDDLGIVEHNKQYYYIPAFSSIYASERRDNDRYYLDRFIKYKEPGADKLDFKSWASLMDEVYKLNHNGKWSVLFAFMSAFRSDIYEVDRIFTALFFIGPTGSGKSEIGYSIRSLFMDPKAALFNLNSGTPAALFTLMERYRNMVLLLDEYNDQQIRDDIFQALKSATYDGEGKQKRKDAASKEIDSSQVNAALVIMGQESPQRDDGSLSNRSIMCPVPKCDDRTEHETEIFLRLKKHEANGLHNILLEILKNRQIVRKNYMRIQRECFKELKDAVRIIVTNTDGLSRILNTVSMFMAVCKIIEEHTSLDLPFTYEEFFEIAKEKVIKQVESISTSNRMFTFFSNINFLIDTGSLKQGRDFKIESPGKITLQKKGRETFQLTLDPPDTRLLHLNLTNIYPLYNQVAKKEALSLQSLYSYMESNEAYIGRTRATRFRWQEVMEVPRGDIVAVTEDSSGVDNTMRKVITPRENNTSSLVLNYDKLKDLLGIDFEREVQEGSKEFEF